MRDSFPPPWSLCLCAWGAIGYAAMACGAMACGSAAPAPTRTPPPLPSTQADPPAYTPTASERGETGEVVGLSASGGRQAARQLALQVVEAVRSGDRDTLGRLLPTRLARSLPRISAVMNASEGVIHGVLDPRHRQAAGTALPLAALVDLPNVQTGPLSERLHARPVPAGLRASDLFVVLPLTPAGRRFFGRLLSGWRLVGGVIVRPGVVPQVLGI